MHVRASLSSDAGRNTCVNRRSPVIRDAIISAPILPNQTKCQCTPGGAHTRSSRHCPCLITIRGSTTAITPKQGHGRLRPHSSARPVCVQEFESLSAIGDICENALQVRSTCSTSPPSRPFRAAASKTGHCLVAGGYYTGGGRGWLGQTTPKPFVYLKLTSNFGPF